MSSSPNFDVDPDAVRDQIRNYKARWKLVNSLQLEEARRVSTTERYRQFIEMVRTAKAMDWRTSTPEEDAEAARRWQLLRQAYLG